MRAILKEDTQLAALESAGVNDAATLQLLADKVQDLECLLGVDPAKRLQKVTAALEEIRRVRYLLQLLSHTPHAAAEAQPAMQLMRHTPKCSCFGPPHNEAADAQPPMQLMRHTPKYSC